MVKTIAKKDLYRNLKTVSDDVMKYGIVYTVLQNSKPAFCITPLEMAHTEKKYERTDVKNFIFDSADKTEKNLATTYKKHLYK
ncbi:MAG: hypothetical protein WC651_00300 [Candidatus Gracilibacteria bacterium]|jgi:hypothetical protein